MIGRKESVRQNSFPNGTYPIEVRHKHDGCWEIYQENLDGPSGAPDIVHIEEEDLLPFLMLLHSAMYTPEEEMPDDKETAPHSSP